jgi:hypothetical protein
MAESRDGADRQDSTGGTLVPARWGDENGRSSRGKGVRS